MRIAGLRRESVCIRRCEWLLAFFVLLKSEKFECNG